MPSHPKAPLTRQELPDHVTMPLLDRVALGAVDQEYAERAERRAGMAAPAAPGGRARAGLTLAAVFVLGLLVATALVQATRISQQDESGRNALLNRIESERQSIEDLQTSLGGLQADVATLRRRDQSLSDELAQRETTAARLGLGSGFAAAQGPGVRIRVDDSPSGNPLEAVRDEDLAILADALWGVGAEAIAINGKRLTVLSAIRNSGDAININGRPLSPPYVVSAIGDPDTLQPDLLASDRGNSWIGLADQLGFDWSMQNVSTLTLPAARVPALRYVVPGLSGRVEKEVSP